MEEPASVASNRCKTSLAPIYGLQSESSPPLHLPLSLLLSSLLEDTNLALARFVKDQTVHRFLPVPDRHHRRYYRTSSSSSFPGPYTILPGLASITLDKVSESKKCSVSLSHSQASSSEIMFSSVCEVTSWLDWWLSTCGGFWEHLPVEVRGNFLGVPGCPGNHGSWQSRVIAPRFPSRGCPVYGPGGRGCTLTLCRPSLVTWNFSVSLVGLCPDQDACGFERRSCSADAASSEDSLEIFSWTVQGWLLVIRFC